MYRNPKTIPMKKNARFARLAALQVLLLWTLSCGAPQPWDDPSDLMSDTWVATDALGRQMPLQETAGPVKEGPHFTGIFYITWHGAGNHDLPGPYTDVTRILQTHEGGYNCGNIRQETWGGVLHLLLEPHETSVFLW